MHRTYLNSKRKTHSKKNGDVSQESIFSMLMEDTKQFLDKKDRKSKIELITRSRGREKERERGNAEHLRRGAAATRRY